MSLTSEQIDAITHTWLDLCASKQHFEGTINSVRQVEVDELAVACRDSVEELEKEFPFLMENAGEVEDE